MNNVDMVANFFISIGMMENEDYMTNLKLQKLVYFAQALSLVKNKKALFEDEFEAWDLGPVIPSLYQKHKKVFLCPSTCKFYDFHSVLKLCEA